MSFRVLFVDDEENLLEGIQRNLRKIVRCFTCTDPIKALEIIKEEEVFPVIVSDYSMPNMDGINFLNNVKTISPNSSRILLTGFADLNTAVKAVNEGSVFRFLIKPCPFEDLTKALNSGYDQFKLITAEKELLDNTLKGSIRILIEILSAINPIAFSRSLKIKNLILKLAPRINMEITWDLEISALLSQIGCVSIPTCIIEKKYKNLPLTPAEEQIFNNHPLVGRNLLKNIPRLEQIAETISNQFCNYNQTEKKQDAIAENNILIIGRILKVINDYENFIDASFTPIDAIIQMKKRKELYDPKILFALEEIISGVQIGYTLCELPLDRITANMILAEDIKEKNGLTYISRGHEISDIIKIRLQNYQKLGVISGYIKVLIPNA